MKTKTHSIFAGLLVMGLTANAQPWLPATAFPTTPIWRSAPVGIGTTGAPSTLYQLEIATGGQGVMVRNNTGSGPDIGLRLDNSFSGGQEWGIFSLSSGPHFAIRDAASTDVLFIEGNVNNVGIGTTSPAGKFHVEETSGNTSRAGEFVFSSGVSGNHQGIRVDASFSSSSGSIDGLEGTASATGSNVDVVGGRFLGIGGTNNFNVGVMGSVTGSGAATNAGVYGNGSATGQLAGYFNGDVFIAGSVTSTGPGSFGSDRKLKNDIRPLTQAIDQLKKLKPSTYTFRTDEEFRGMNLPQGKQMGLIAQELEEIFPELVTEVPAYPRVDEKGRVIGTNPSFKAVNYINLIALLISSVQEQQKQIDELLKRQDTGTGIQQLSNPSSGFAMAQNEPNPFTHETVINYILPASVNSAYVAVYDLSGKQISTFPITEKGASSITLTSEHLAAGIYIYSIVADGKSVDSKRMIVSDK